MTFVNMQAGSGIEAPIFRKGVLQQTIIFNRRVSENPQNGPGYRRSSNVTSVI
jgi:hypothetical protein